MESSIFMISNDETLTQLRRSEYDSEDLLQQLLADHPAVLGLTAEGEGRLLLIKREQEVPDAEGGAGRWSLDHLFVDRNGVPVLVEVKRASDTRARREVVAQMLDYAANGVSYWPIVGLIDAFRRSCEKKGQSPEAQLATFLEEGVDAEPFWRQVEANLRSGRIRMVFVADRIPSELRRIVEFLNEQMRPAEVLAIEVAQYTSSTGVRTLVPVLVGMTERAQSNKSTAGPTEQLSLEQWLAKLASNYGAPAKQGAERAVTWFRSQGCEVAPTDSQDALYVRVSAEDGKYAWPFFIRSNGRLQTSLQYLQYRPVFASDEARANVLARLKALPVKLISTDKLTGWPSIPLAEFLRDDLWQEFSILAQWIMSEASKS